MDITRFADSPIGRLVPIRGTDGRTGVEYEHVAYVPDALAEEPILTGATWHAVARAEHALGRLYQAARQVPSPALLRRPTLRREAQSTSALEGTFAPLEDVLAADLVTGRGRSAEVHEVMNYIDTAEAAFGWLDDGRRVTVGMLCELQAILVAGTPAATEEAGRVRRIPVAIGSRGDSLAHARFVPPPPGHELDAGLTDLVAWINARTGDRSPIVAAAMGHYQFETLHPFNDGNGRIGRLLIVLQLMQEGVLADPLLSVSPWFEARRAEYQDRLAAVNADGDWDGWIRFFAAGLRASAVDTARRVDRLLEVQERFAIRLRDAGITGFARDVAAKLIAYPFVTVSAIADAHGRSFQAANHVVRRLEGLDILKESTGRAHGRMFAAPEVLAVLTAPSEE